MKTGHQFSLRALRALHHKVSLWRHTFTWLFFTEQTSCVFRVEEKSFVMSVKVVNDYCTGGFHGCHQIFQITLTKRKGQCDMIKFFFLIFLFCFAHSETFSLITFTFLDIQVGVLLSFEIEVKRRAPSYRRKFSLPIAIFNCFVYFSEDQTSFWYHGSSLQWSLARATVSVNALSARYFPRSHSFDWSAQGTRRKRSWRHFQGSAGFLPCFEHGYKADVF